MIKLVDISVECFDSLNFEIGAGSVCKIIGNSNTEINILFETMLSLKKPISGSVFLFNEDIFTMPNHELIKLLSRVGVVWQNGGLISNLKVWENLTLAASYYGLKHEMLEDKVIDIYNQLGINEALPELMGMIPAHLTDYEKKITAIIRAMIMNPDIMMYNIIFTGLEDDLIKNISEQLLKFHFEKPDRISVFFSDEERVLKHIEGRTIRLQKILND